MLHRPGSFTRNFAWHGNGLSKLYMATRLGFSGNHAPVGRGTWRAASGIGDRDISLIPPNFFLFNQGEVVCVDELVARVLQEPHSVELDRLALFALNLSRVGSPPGSAVARPMMWANEFVREHLFVGDRWVRSRLSPWAMDRILEAKLHAEPSSRIKCRNNYRHLYDLCRHFGDEMGVSHDPKWIASALFLAWDRYSLDGVELNDSLLEVTAADEVHKLLGLPGGEVDLVTRDAFPRYLAQGGIRRLTRH